MPEGPGDEDPRRYVNRHGIEPLINQMINLTIISRADDPESYMVRWLYDQCTPGQRRKAEVEPVDPEEPQGLPSLERAVRVAAQQRVRDRSTAGAGVAAEAAATSESEHAEAADVDSSS
mmetsp:Transcript_56037/g.103703  ORF Transcript_56037/g.103703 Transcript_56037/m.103703 type:complete len:119 (-) Transcript_56037:89-445(-)